MSQKQSNKNLKKGPQVADTHYLHIPTVALSISTDLLQIDNEKAERSLAKQSPKRGEREEKMKATATRNISSRMAQEMINKIIDNLIEEVATLVPCPCLGTAGCTCEAKHVHNEVKSAAGEVSIKLEPDYFGSRIEASWNGNNLLVEATTCGGHIHRMSVDFEGRLEVAHEGARSSYPGTLFEYLPGAWFKINHASNWTLTEVETSEPDWAVPIGLLRGKFGEGPQNLSEYEELE